MKILLLIVFCLVLVLTSCATQTDIEKQRKKEADELERIRQNEVAWHEAQISYIEKISVDRPQEGQYFYNKNFDYITYSKELIILKSSKEDLWNLKGESYSKGRGFFVWYCSTSSSNMSGGNDIQLTYRMYVKNSDESIETLTLNADEENSIGEKKVRIVFSEDAPRVIEVWHPSYSIKDSALYYIDENDLYLDLKNNSYSKDFERFIGSITDYSRYYVIFIPEWGIGEQTIDASIPD